MKTVIAGTFWVVRVNDEKYMRYMVQNKGSFWAEKSHVRDVEYWARVRDEEKEQELEERFQELVTES